MTDTAAAPSRVRLLLVLLGASVIAVVVYLFLVAPLLAGAPQPVAADDAPLAATVQNDPFGQDPQGDPDAPPLEAPESTPLPETFEVFTSRDPFQQLVDADSGGGGSTSSGTTSPGTTSPGTTSPGTTSPGTTSPGTTSPGTTTPGTTSPGTTPPASTSPPATRVGTTVIRVVEVSRTDGVERVTITVNGTGHTVGEGETFARSFRVLDITGDCATLLFGDSRFTLCAGEEIRK
jgi:hypothetical protein